MSICRQGEWLGRARASFYDEPATEAGENWRLLRLLDEPDTAQPVYGSRRMAVRRHGRGHAVNRPRVQRRRRMGVEASDPKPQRSAPGQGHKVYPYLLRGATLGRVAPVGSTAIT